MFIQATKACGGPGGLDWPEDGAVIEVTDPAVAADLLLRPDDFRAVPAPAEKPVRVARKDKNSA